MQQAMGKIYHGCWSRWIQHPYFSEILIMRYIESDSEPAVFKLLRSVRETELQGDGVLISNVPDLRKLDHFYQYWERSNSCFLRIISTMDRIFEEATYDIHISPSHWFTLVAEFYLNIVVKHLYQRLHPDLDLYRPPIYKEFKFDICLLHAHPSEKIIIALRAIFYLCSELATTWRAPYGFSLFTFGLLKVLIVKSSTMLKSLIAIPILKYNLDVQEMSEVTSWLELLKSDEGEEIELDLNYDFDDDSDELFEEVSVSYIPVFHRNID